MAVEFGSPKGPHHSPIIRVGAYEKDIRKEYEKQLLKWILIAPEIATGRSLLQDGSVMIRPAGRLLQTAEEAPTIRLGFFTWGISGKSFLPSLISSF